MNKHHFSWLLKRNFIKLTQTSNNCKFFGDIHFQTYVLFYKMIAYYICCNKSSQNVNMCKLSVQQLCVGRVQLIK